MEFEDLFCPRCGNGLAFEEFDCGPDTYDDDISYTSYKCCKCGLWYDGWVDKWFVDVDNWREVEGAAEYQKESK